jgi:hypothetical protein
MENILKEKYFGGLLLTNVQKHLGLGFEVIFYSLYDR